MQVVAPPARTPAVPHLAKWVPGDISCDNGRTLSSDTINPAIPFRLRNAGRPTDPVTYEFTLGSEARALSIRMVNDQSRRRRISDLPPAIAGSQFPAFSQNAQCRVTFEYETTPLGQVSLEDFMRLRAYNRNARIPSEEWARFAPGNCLDKPSQRPLLVAFPDFREIAKSPGRRDWVFMTYSTDETGRPVDLSIVGSSGNSELNKAGLAALEKSRWTQPNREGCFRYFYTGNGVIEAPEKQEIETYGTFPEACDADDKWAREPVLRYPSAYQRRAVEGWAVLRYDVAPWGEIGNVEVIDAQPTEEMGRQAITVLTSAQFKPLEAGLTGCIERVIFRLPEEGASNSGGDAEAQG